MKLKHVFALFLVCLIIFTPYFLRDGFRGYDSYYFLNYVCKGEQFDLFDHSNSPPLSTIILQGLPCNVFLLKIALFILFFADVLIIALTGQLLYKDGWLAGIFAFLSPILWFNALKLENDSFAFPFVFAAIYYFVRFHLKQEKKDFIKSLIAIGIGASLWGGTLYLPFAFALQSVPFMAIALATGIYFGRQLLSNALPITTVLESNPTGAITNFIFFFFAIVGLQKTRFLAIIVFFMGFSLVNPKFSIFVIPFLSLLVLDTKPFIPEKWFKLLPYIAIGLVFAWAALVFYSDNPSDQEIQITGIAVEKARELDKKLFNEWPFGYIVEWFDGNASSWAGSQDLNTYKGVPTSLEDSIVLTHQELDCPIIDSAYYSFSDNKKMFVYDC